MSLYRHLLRRSLFAASSSITSPLRSCPAIYGSARAFAFSSAEEAAAERRRRKRRLRIEPPISFLRRDSGPRPPRDPNAPRLPDSTSALVGNRLRLHNDVQSAIRAGELDEASVIARQAVFSSVRPTVFTCNAIIASMYRAGRFDEAVDLFRFFFEKSNIVPNVVSYNYLIKTHCDAGRVDTALEVYQHILENAPFSPSHVTYQHLTKGLVDADRMQDAMSMLREMIAKGNGADSLVYNNLMAGYIDRDDWPKALELFEELGERCLVYDGVVHATIMEGYWKKGMDKEAMASYQSLLDKGFKDKMTPNTCNVFLQCLLKHGKVNEANRLFEYMLDRHNPPAFQGINPETYNIMVNECFKNGDCLGAVETFQRTGAKTCMMDVGSYNNIISKLLDNGLPSEAEKLFQRMQEKSVLSDVHTYGYFIDFYFKDGKPDESLKWFQNILQNKEGGTKPRKGTFNKMFDGLVKAGKIDTAIEFFKTMWDQSLKPNSLSYEIMVPALCEKGMLDQARSFVEEMMRNRVPEPPKLREIVSEAFTKAGRGEEIEMMFAPPPPPPPPPRRVPNFADPRGSNNGFSRSWQPAGSFQPSPVGSQPGYANNPNARDLGGPQPSLATGPQAPTSSAPKFSSVADMQARSATASPQWHAGPPLPQNPVPQSPNYPPLRHNSDGFHNANVGSQNSFYGSSQAPVTAGQRHQYGGDYQGPSYGSPQGPYFSGSQSRTTEIAGSHPHNFTASPFPNTGIPQVRPDIGSNSQQSSIHHPYGAHSEVASSQPQNFAASQSPNVGLPQVQPEMGSNSQHFSGQRPYGIPPVVAASQPQQFTGTQFPNAGHTHVQHETDTQSQHFGVPYPNGAGPKSSNFAVSESHNYAGSSFPNADGAGNYREVVRQTAQPSGSSYVRNSQASYGMTNEAQFEFTHQKPTWQESNYSYPEPAEATNGNGRRF